MPAIQSVIVLGASAGGVESLREVVEGLPPDLPAAVLVVLHVPSATPSALPKILSECGKLPANHPQDGEELRAARTARAAHPYSSEICDFGIWRGLRLYPRFASCAEYK